MSTDEDYASFLEKANQDTSSSKPTTSSTNQAQIKTVDREVPPVLKSVKQDYISETEGEFKPIALKWSGKGDFNVGKLLSPQCFLKAVIFTLDKYATVVKFHVRTLRQKRVVLHLHAL